MAADNSEVLDISKENIQPLRYGRKAAQLKTALQAQADPDVHQQLMKQREKFEFMIRMYEGDDPLDPYYNYILWLEQSFPSAGRENNIPLLLEDTLLKFKDDEQYRQDPRLAQLIVKYINIQSNSLELYQLVYNLGLGTMCSSLYKAWAEELEKANDFKRADQVFQIGLQCRAQPVQELEDAHVQFQLSIARKLLEGGVNVVTASSKTDEQSRAALSKLPSKVKSNRVSKDSAGIFSLQSKSRNSKSSNFGTSKFRVYEEESNENQLQSRYKNETEILPNGSSAHRENVMGTSKWCGQKAKQVAYKTSSSSAPDFEIHEDPEAAYENVKTVIRPCALKTRKEEFKCPVAIFGPSNPNQIPMYPKQLVYVGGRDIQLEEIRAAFYWKKIEKEERMKADSKLISQNFDNEYSQSSSQKQSASLSPENLPCGDKRSEKASSFSFTKNISARDTYCDNNVRKSERYTKYFQPSDSQPISGCDMLITPARPVANIEVHLDEDDPSSQDYENKSAFSASKSTSVQAPRKSIFSQEERSCSSKSSSSRESTSAVNVCSLEQNFEFRKPTLPSSKPKSFDVFVDDDFSGSRGFDRKQTDDFDLMSTASQASGSYFRKSEGVVNFGNAERENINFNQSLSTSMTINTKAAMNVIQQMWESPSTRQDNFEKIETMDLPPPIKSNKCLFTVYCEDDDPAAKENKPSSSNKLPFAVFCDDTFSQPKEKHSTKSNDLASSLSSKSKSDTLKSSSSLKKNSETERKFGTPLPLIVPVKLHDSPVQPENKENRFPAENLSPEDPKDCVDENEEHFSGAPDCEIDDETCNTKIFAVTLPSSTPCLLKEKSRASRKSVYEDSYLPSDNDFSLCYLRSAPKMDTLHNTSECHKRFNKTGSDLSLILENSKEQGSGSSSSSSGNTGSKLFLS